MDLTIHSAMLPQTDPDAAKKFYCETLGWELRNDVGYNGLHWLTVGPPEQPQTALVLYPPEADPGATDAEREMIAAMMAKGTYASVNLASTDVDKVFESLQAADAEIMQEPTDQPYGIRDCAVRDPAGNTVRIQQVA